MRIIVTGGGAIGRHLSADLTSRGHDVTLIEQDKETVVELMGEIPDVHVVHGDAELRPGVRLRIGTALCEVSAYAIPCSQNRDWFLDGRFDDEVGASQRRLR